MLQGDWCVEIELITKWNCWNFVYVWETISTSIFWYNDPSHGTFGKRSKIMWLCLSKMDVHFWEIHETLEGYARDRTWPERCIVEETIEFSIDVNQTNRVLSGAVVYTINRE